MRPVSEIDTNVEAAAREAMETECDSEPPAKPAVQAPVDAAPASELELRCRLLRNLHGAELYHWPGSAE